MFSSREPYREMRRRFIRLKGDGQLCRFKILFVSHRPVDMTEGAASLIDISRGGLGLASRLKLPVHLPTLLLVRFTLNHQQFMIAGRLVWRRRLGQEYRYGLNFWGSSKEETAELHQRLDRIYLDVKT